MQGDVITALEYYNKALSVYTKFEEKKEGLLFTLI
jgi:hypothetical protein